MLVGLLEYDGTMVSLCLAIYVIFSVQKGYIRQWGQTLSLITGLTHALALSLLVAVGLIELAPTYLESVNLAVFLINAIGAGFLEYIFFGLLRSEYIKSKTPVVYPSPGG